MTDAMRTLRAVRHYLPDPVPVAVIEDIVDIARWTGSARNRQPWRFVAVTNPAVRSALSRLRNYAAHLATAPLVMVLASPDDGRADTEFDMGRVAQSICLAAQRHDLGTCPTTLHPDDNARHAAALLALAAPWVVRHAIAVGYPDAHELGPPTAIRPGRLPVSELLTRVT